MRLIDHITSLGWETKRFPVELCTAKAQEKGIQDSTVPFLCIVVDKRSSSHGGLHVLYPYTAKNLPELIRAGEAAILFGWRDKDGNYYDHFENNVHEDDAVVVAWHRLPDDETDLRDLAGIAH